MPAITCGPEYQRFVGLAGVDDGLVGEDYGALIAGKPALVFQVFIDGELAAGSPVLRISQEPWRFDVPIPSHSRQINLVATSRGENYPYSLGNWVEAGFITGTDYSGLEDAGRDEERVVTEQNLCGPCGGQPRRTDAVCSAAAAGHQYRQEPFRQVDRNARQGGLLSALRQEWVYATQRGLEQSPYADDRRLAAVRTRSSLPPDEGAPRRLLCAPGLPGGSGCGSIRADRAETTENTIYWLDRFESVDVFLYPGRVSYTCADRSLGVTIRLEVDLFMDRFGFAVPAPKLTVQAPARSACCGLWGVLRTREALPRQKGATSNSPRSASRSRRSARGAPPRTVNSGGRRCACLNVNDNAAIGAGSPDADSARCALVIVPLHGDSGKTVFHDFVLVWGYSDFDHASLESAFQRIRFRPFPDAGWLEKLKARYFEHWIGKGLEPETRFCETRRSLEDAVARSRAFWEEQCSRFSVRTPDPYLDTVVNSMAASAYMHYEYPAFIHGLEIHKYGKINHGYYGFESAGLHDEVSESLKFVSGAQCVKGRQRYFSPALAISSWAEDMDFYFVEQVWYHWRWTGDTAFLAAMWPAARRALEHGLAVSDPDGDGIMAGYYEQWNCDGNDSGDRGVLQTAMAWSALRAASQMAAALGDVDYLGHPFQGAFQPDPPDYAERYRRWMARIEEQFGQHLWNNDIGAWSSAEPNGIIRPRAHSMEQNYHTWRGFGDLMRNYMGLRFIREEYQRSDLLPGATFEFINDFWPVIWSQHYVASGDTLATFLSACAVGDEEKHWPAFQTVSDTAYTFGGPVWHHVGCRTMETDPMYLQAVIDGIFGLKPWLNENLLVVRPAFPRAWKEAECQHRDIRYTYRRSATETEIIVHTPVPRRLRVELPVTAPVHSVTLDGKPTDYRIEASIHQARVVIEAPESTGATFAVITDAIEPIVEGTLRRVVGQWATFVAGRVDAVEVIDPQGGVREITLIPGENRKVEVSFVPARPGRLTVFLRLTAKSTSWLHPLDLTIVEPMRIVTHFAPGMREGGPAVTSPRLDPEHRTLHLRVENNNDRTINGRAQIMVGPHRLEKAASLPAMSTTEFEIDLQDAWATLSPGTTRRAL